MAKKKKKDTVKRIKDKPQNKAEKKIFSQYASYKELLLKLSKLNIKKTTQFFKWAKDFFLIGKEFKREFSKVRGWQIILSTISHEANVNSKHNKIAVYTY